MDFKWENYLKLAKKLQKIPIKDMQLDEACHRTVISRAYYAIYNLALKFAENKIGYIRKTGIEAGKNHNLLRIEFNEWSKKHSVFEYNKLANILDRIHKNRIKSDYHNNIGKTKPLMDFTILEADEAISIISSKNP